MTPWTPSPPRGNVDRLLRRGVADVRRGVRPPAWLFALPRFESFCDPVQVGGPGLVRRRPAAVFPRRREHITRDPDLLVLLGCVPHYFLLTRVV